MYLLYSPDCASFFLMVSYASVPWESCIVILPELIHLAQKVFSSPQGIIEVRDDKEFLGHLTLSLTIFYNYEYVLSSFIYCWSGCERISLVHITENPWEGSGQKSVAILFILLLLILTK